MEQPQSQPAAASTPPAAAPEGLFTPITKPAPPPVATEAPPANDWFIMGDMKGEGARPDFLSPKYKSLAEQAKAYTELEKKLGVQKAPDKYDLEKYSTVLAPDDMKTQKLLHFAREKQLGQDVLDGFLDVFAEHVASQKVDYSKEIEKLGPGGREKINTVMQWAQNTLSNDAIDIINKIGHSADAIRLLDELRQYSVHTSINPPAPGQSIADFIPLKVEDVEAEMKANYNRYMTDPKYRAEIKAKFAQAVGDE